MLNAPSEPTTAGERWREWFTAHGAALLLFARQVAPSPADAEDVVQEAFVRTWRHVGGHGAEDPRPLLFLNVKRAAVDLGRSHRSRLARQSAWLAEAGDAGPLFERPLEGDERRQAIEEALRGLPVGMREVVTLKVWGGLTLGEIAEALDLPPGTVASRYRSALQQMKRQLEETNHA